MTSSDLRDICVDSCAAQELRQHRRDLRTGVCMKHEDMKHEELRSDRS